MKDPSLVLCNSGPLMALGKLNRLELLDKTYSGVLVPRAVYDEVVVQGLARGSDDAQIVKLFCRRQGWPMVDLSRSVLDRYRPTRTLDTGETQVLALARAQPGVLVLLDDELARQEARESNLRVKGTLGVLVQSYHQDHLSYSELEILVQEIEARSDIWISSKLCQDVLDAARRQ